jgi:hypothetical protein
VTLPLYAEDAAFWDRLVQLLLVGLLVRLADDNRCPLCKYREPDGWLTRHPMQQVLLATLIAPFLLHLKSTHGHDPEFVVDTLLSGRGAR